MEISIIIPSKDRRAILIPSLEKAYLAIQNIDAEIIIINDSKTEEIIINPTWSDKVKVINNPKGGVASARNLGANNAAADLLLFMDDDMWITEENLRTTLALHKQYPENSCINLNWVYPSDLVKRLQGTQFGRYLSFFGFDTLKGWNRDLFWDDTKIFATEGITSQYLAIPKAEFFRAGEYNENFPHAGFEDYDFGKRLRKLNIQPYIYPLSVTYHNEADRMEVKPWLARKRRGGETRRAAVALGYSDLKIENGRIKTILYKILVIIQPLLVLFLYLIPNVKFFDPVYFKILNILLGTVFFEGYHKYSKKLPL